MTEKAAKEISRLHRNRGEAAKSKGSLSSCRGAYRAFAKRSSTLDNVNRVGKRVVGRYDSITPPRRTGTKKKRPCSNEGSAVVRPILDHLGHCRGLRKVNLQWPVDLSQSVSWR